MKDQTFLNNLADFKDIRLNSRSELMDIQNRSRDSLLSKNSHLDFELDLHNNDKLLKNFKQLREQLKQSTKICQKLKTKVDEKDSEIERLRQSERDYISINHQLKHEMEHIKNSNEDLKGKIELLKSMTKNSNQAEEQLQFLKITISNLKSQIGSLQDEKNKLLELSIIEKVELEEKIKRFEAKKNSDIAYVQQMEIQVSKFRQKTIKLENQLKRIQIKYDEELYTKQWANGNFERQHLQQQLRQAESENEDLLIKHKKQKQRRAVLEKRVLELQEATGLWIVKAQTYEVENRGLQKKYKQIHKKNQQLKEQSNKKVSQILTLQQKFAKSVAIADELISRVKRELYGDMVALAKSCEFKLSKLKEQKDTFFKNMENEQQQQLKKSASQLKMRSKSKQHLRDRCQEKDGIELDQKQTMMNLKQKFEECIKPQMQTQTQIFLNNSEKTKSNYEQSGRSNGTFASNLQHNPLGHIQNIEGRIKRQRDQMERKIREKMLYRKIEVAHSPEKHQLREDYFRLFEH